MKNYLSKLFCLLVLVTIYGCSNEQSEDTFEENAFESAKIDKVEEGIFNARKSLIKTIYIQCNTPNILNNCLSDFNQYVTIISSTPSITCPGLFEVVVYVDEFYAHYNGAWTEGLNVLIRPPFGTTIPTRPTEPYSVDDCF